LIDQREAADRNGICLNIVPPIAAGGCIAHS
jgi:hypothetical protein